MRSCSSSSCFPLPPPLPDDNNGVDEIVVFNPYQNAVEDEDEEMVIALTQAEEEIAIGGQATLCQIIVKTYVDSIAAPLK